MIEKSSYQSKTEPASILVVAGDVSADRHVGLLLEQLKVEAPHLQTWGLGSTKMKAAGTELLYDCKEFSSIGIIGVLRLIPFLRRMGDEFLAQIAIRKPQAVLLVDYGGFNLPLASAIKKQFPGLPILYFISPQVWGSRPWRINTIAKTVSKMLVIFPFEKALYEDKGVPVRFVGHPLTKNIPSFDDQKTRLEISQKYGLNPANPIVAVFSGSRRSEIPTLFPVIIDAMVWLSEIRPSVQFAISKANEELGKQIESALEKARAKGRLKCKVVTVDSAMNYELITASDLVWAKSGTTSLEVTLLGKPMLVFYRGDWLSYFIFLAFKRVRRVSWPNLLAGKALVPELIQLDYRAEQLVKYTSDLLDVPALRQEIASELRSLRDQLGEGDYARAVVEEILETTKHQELIAKS